MGERAGRKSSTTSKPKATNAVRFSGSADLAQFLVTLVSHGASYTVQDDDGGWLVDITGV